MFCQTSLLAKLAFLYLSCLNKSGTEINTVLTILVVHIYDLTHLHSVTLSSAVRQFVNIWTFHLR